MAKIDLFWHPRWRSIFNGTCLPSCHNFTKWHFTDSVAAALLLRGYSILCICGWLCSILDFFWTLYNVLHHETFDRPTVASTEKERDGGDGEAERVVEA